VLAWLYEYLLTIRRLGRSAKLLLMATAFSYAAQAIYNLIFNLYIYSLGYRQDFIGLLNGLPALVVLLVGLPVGMAAGRRGYLGFLRAGTLLTAASYLGLALAGSRAPLVFFALMGGVGGAMSWVISIPFQMTICRPEERVVLLAVNRVIALTTGFLGSLLGGVLPGTFARWWDVAVSDPEPLRGALLVTAAFSALAVFPFLVIKEAPTRRQTVSRPLPQGRAEILLFAKLLTPTALTAFGAGVMVVFFQLFFRLRFNLEPGAIGVLFALGSLTTAAATLVSPLLARRLGKVRTVVFCEMASIPFLLLLAYSYNLRWVVAAYYFRHALMNMSNPVLHVFQLEQVREDQRATLSSLSVMLGSLGKGGLGPIVSGFIQLQAGFTSAFTLTGICYVLGAILFYVFFRHAERPRPAGDGAFATEGSWG